MKATGIMRRIDDLGRISIPKEVRRMMRIEDGYPIEIYTEDNKIILVPYQRSNELTRLLDNALTLMDKKAFIDAEYPTEPNRAEKIKELVKTAFLEAAQY